ncbi:MAG: carbon storage regulator [Planctomycetota bacterium]|jgi:carbon storage regulator
MLVLARRAGQAIQIGEGPSAAIVTVLNVNGTVRLGVEAPRNVPVDRGELVERIAREGRRKPLPK